MTVNINKPQINLREQLKKLERPTTDRLAVKGADGVLIDKLTGELSLQGIDAMAGGTAVDVFVYDTSKDSDGGAWRYRTKSTSWFNETLNTQYRGSRREFPAVAVIVVETTKVTIYDGDDPDLRMWMVLLNGSSGAGNNGHMNANAYTALGANYPLNCGGVAKNGLIVIGNYASGDARTTGGVILVDFIKDNSKLTNASSQTFIWKHGLSARNDNNSWNLYSSQTIRSARVNDVAMKVLPNAPIDNATGLPVPTIAVGTNDGVSIIKHDETVIDYTHQNAAYDVTSFVEFLSDTRVAYGWDNNDTPRRLHITPIRGADIATVDPGSYPRDSTDTVGYGRPEDNKSVGNYHGFLVGNDQSVAAAMEESRLAVGDGAHGLNFIDVQEAGVDIFDSEIAFITSNYNTGWQHGNIKGTFLSDTDATNTSELVTNGTFGSNVNGWNSGDPSHVTVSHTSGTLQVTSSSGNDGSRYAYQKIDNVPPGTYRVTATAVSNTSNRALLRVGTADAASSGGGNATNILNSGYLSGNNVTSTHVFTTTETLDIVITLFNDYGAGSGTWDNVKLHRAVEDRSVNRNPLQVFGAITRSPVATGADLVAYSGFSDSNYLEQPFNSDMQFGTTGDFSVAFWMKQTSPATFSGIIDNGYNSSGNFYFLVGTDSNGKLFFRTSDSSGQSDKTASSQGVVTGGEWRHIVCTRTDNGTQMNMFIDGRLDGNSGSVTARNVTNSLDQPLKIGNRSNSTNRFFTGSLALVRVSASAPSAALVKKMYEDEKHLFQENAACTLHGTSDAITGLAYDTTTKSLHAGTSSGRSEFKGLRRVSNTTIGVTTAISASNGLVAEQ